KYLCNVNVLTTGFDAPNIDCVVLLRPTLSAGLFYQMCLDMETEVLTRSGWRRCHEVTTGDVVAAFDLDTEEVVYVPTVDKVHRALRSGEEMYGVSAPHLDLRVTDQHTMIVRARARTCLHWQLQTASEVSRRRSAFTIPVAGRGNDHRLDAGITDAEVEFIGWFLTDGYLNPSNRTVTISQSTEKFAAEIRDVLTACGFGFREYPLVRQGEQAGYADSVQFVIPRGVGRGTNHGLRGWAVLEEWLDKDVPAVFNTLSRRQFAILLDAMNMANGRNAVSSDYVSRVMSIAVGCRQRMADRMQQLAIERGYRCNISRFVQKPSDWNRSPQPQWMIYVKPQCVAHVGGLRENGSELVPRRCRIQPVEFERNEWVWCLTTEKGTLVTRRNGKVAILGNCGRGFRFHPGKANCLVLDYGGNVLRHGPVDQLQVVEKRSDGDGPAPAKQCPSCRALIAPAYSICPQCGHEFPPPERKKHESQATNAGVLSGQVSDAEFDVRDIRYSVHTKKDADDDAPKTLRVDYRLGLDYWVSEWICFEHSGWPRRKAEQWWQARSPDPCPDTAQQACDLANNGALAHTESVTVRSVAGEKFDRIHNCKLGPKPELSPMWEAVDLSDVPF
ncbi:MAG: hypothetical protein KDA58_15945, partial [Planctomycetaceae bacterium]|nr:hypothetical protein [Planctomycetaceae bacterium]